MIKINLPSPPDNYEAEVKIPGNNFLKHSPNPSTPEWKKHNYWAKLHNYLYTQHNGICLYCASWTPRQSILNRLDHHTSVDHFQPKTHHPELAYEWSNFRLCRERLHQYKADFEDVLDPCSISNDWFYLDFTSFLIKPSSTVADLALKQKISNTVSRLRLNSDDYVNERIQVITEYSKGKLGLNMLNEKFPFIAYQMKVQNFDQIFKERIKVIT